MISPDVTMEESMEVLPVPAVPARGEDLLLSLLFESLLLLDILSLEEDPGAPVSPVSPPDPDAFSFRFRFAACSRLSPTDSRRRAARGDIALGEEGCDPVEPAIGRVTPFPWGGMMKN